MDSNPQPHSSFDIPAEELAKRQKTKKQGVIMLGAICLGILVFLGGIVALSFRGSESSETSTNQANVGEPAPTVTLTTVYENPLNEEVVEDTNPFYSNPFEELEALE